MLKVPYVAQFNDHACGAAVLQMIYRYYGLKNISQEQIFKEYKDLEPHGSGNFMIATNDLVLDAKKRGFYSYWKRTDYTNLASSMSLLSHLIEDCHIPIIVCQKFTEQQPQLGHFRVVFGIDKNVIHLHDPYRKTIGKNQKWSYQKFMEFWQPTGSNVTGGVYVVIKRTN